jgi:hypothetical protein
MMVLAYCASLSDLRISLDLMIDNNLYPNYVKRFKNLQGEEKTVIVGRNSKTAVIKINGDSESLCNFEIDNDGLDFLAAAELQILAIGENRGGVDDPYNLVQQDSDALAIYERFYPRIQPTDEDDNPVGPTVFNRGVELARG